MECVTGLIMNTVCHLNTELEPNTQQCQNEYLGENSVIQNMYYEKLNLLGKLVSKFYIKFYIKAGIFYSCREL